MHFFLFCLGLYFLPTIIAALRHTHNTGGVPLVNLFFGWTAIGWFVALLMAVCSTPACYYLCPRGW